MIDDDDLLIPLAVKVVFVNSMVVMGSNGDDDGDDRFGKSGVVVWVKKFFIWRKTWLRLLHYFK